MSNAENIRFSVIIPAFNASGTMRAALDSILQQTYPAFEIIVVNDGSTDATATLLAGYGDAIKYIDLAGNYGPAHARNIGLSRAAGTHIAFQDADDYWHKDKLQVMASVLAKHPEATFIYHPYTLAPMNFEVVNYDQQLVRYPFARLLLSNPIGTPCVIMKQNPAIHFNESMHYMEDYDLFLREGYEHRIHFLNIPLTQLGRPILSAGGQSSKRWKMRKGEFKAYLNLMKLNPLFLFICFWLILFGLIKHGVKSFFPPRTNY